MTAPSCEPECKNLPNCCGCAIDAADDIIACFGGVAQAVQELHAWRFIKSDGQWSAWIVLHDAEAVTAFKDLMGHKLERGTHQLQSFFAAPSTVSSTHSRPAASESRVAERLADVVMMLDTPDAYNREYIAAVCRSILSSLSSTDRADPEIIQSGKAKWPY